MSKIGFKLLQTSKTSDERQIYVVHRHKNSDFQRSVGLSILPRYFDLKTGRATGVSNAPEINKVIQQLVSDIETAARNCEGRGVEPTKPVIQAAYEELLANDSLRANFKASKAKIAGSVIECLYEELRALEAAVIAKRVAIEAEELKQGVFKNMLLADYIDKYIQARRETLAANSIRLFPNLKEWVMKFKAAWRIDEVNKSTLTSFQNYLIKQDKKSSSIADLITKLKSIVYASPFGKPVVSRD